MMVGTVIGPYRIESKLGEGGMGEVYRASDSRLGRDVAVKILPAPFVADADRLARFQLEARLLASVNHPNIATIHSLEDFAGAYALVMELVGGETLAERLAGGAFPVPEALRVATQIADALGAAHGRGVLHRDVKPANIKVTPEGRVKLLDFGLAKATPEWIPDRPADTAAAAVTEAGVFLGTPAYMSPEQICGRGVDARTDLWAFGCVLFELLTGTPPFAGQGVMEIAAAVLRAEPDWLLLPAAVPPGVRRLLRSCLDKDPEARPGDFAEAQKLLRGGNPAAVVEETEAERSSLSSLAVLPFANLGGDPEMEYLSDGLTESLIVALSRVPRLRVMSRTAVFRYKDGTKQALDAGRELGVSAVLTGSVLQRSDTLVINAELVDAGKGWLLWGSQYKRPRSAIFEIEDELSRDIAEKLHPRLGASQIAAKRYTDNAEAYHLYLQGRFYWAKRTEAGLKKAIQYFRQAIELDPTYALAHAGLAEGHVPLAVYCHLPATDAFPKARAAAVMALELDPRLAEARTVLAAYKAGHEWDLAGAEAEVRTALADNPQYSRAWQGLAEICTASRRLAEAEAAAKRALELDPLALSLNAFMSMTYFFSNRPDDAIEYGRRTVEMDPAFFPGHLCCGLALQAGGRLDEAADAMQRGYEASAGSTLMLAALGSAAAARGDRSRAAAILRELEDAGRRRYVSAVWVAAIHHALGDDESAIASLERGCRERCYWLIRAVTVDPRFDGLRRDPRLDDVRRRMGLAGAGGA